MPFVTVQLGQCGNQIGTEFFKAVARDAFTAHGGCSKSADESYRADVLDRFFTRRDGGSGRGVYHPRSVLIDMEPKVIAQSVTTAQHSEFWQYSSRQTFSKRSGSGNNWSYGYCVHGVACESHIEELVRYQVEQCDRFDGFLCLMSLAGGTGSGVGTFVTELFRDLYSKSFIVNQVVSPFQSGEVIVQNYNALLTLAHLYQASDGLIVVENDEMQRICLRRLGMKQVSFQHINKVVAHKMANLLAPAASCQFTNTNHLGHYVEDVFAHPSYRLSSLLTVPLMSDASVAYSTYQWPALIKTLRQMLIASWHMEEGINWRVKVRPASDYNRSLANVLVKRGKESDACDHSSLAERDMCPSWLPTAGRLSAYHSRRAFSGYEKSLSLLTNSQICVNSVDRLVDKAWNMFTSRAYLHHYTRHGLTEQHFTNCFTTLEEIIENYRAL